jgi:hypothetical protein
VEELWSFKTFDLQMLMKVVARAHAKLAMALPRIRRNRLLHCTSPQLDPARSTTPSSSSVNIILESPLRTRRSSLMACFLMFQWSRPRHTPTVLRKKTTSPMGRCLQQDGRYRSGAQSSHRIANISATASCHANSAHTEAACSSNNSYQPGFLM